MVEKDSERAGERAKALQQVLQEAGAQLYGQAAPGGPQARPTVGEPTGEARPSGSGPRGRVVDAEYRETSSA